MAFDQPQLYYAAAVLAVLVLAYYGYRAYKKNHCANNGDCPSGYMCIGGQCVLQTTPICAVDTDCLSGQACVNGVCTTAPPMPMR
jgi:hypothetical protein